MEAKDNEKNRAGRNFSKSSKTSDSDEDSFDTLECDEAGAPSSNVVALRDGYNQIYIIRRSSSPIHEVLFRCGNWCYAGKVDLGSAEIGLAHVPTVIPALQKQQSSLQYLCEWKNMPTTSTFSPPLETLYDAFDFIGEELASSRIERKIIKATKQNSWIDEEIASAGPKTFFELQTGGYESFDEVELIASKTFVRGLLMLIIYSQKSFYIALERGEGEQPLLNVRFPNLSSHLQGVHLQAYSSDDCTNMKKLTLWQVHSPTGHESPVKPVKLACKDVSGKGYTQTFLIRKVPERSGNDTSKTHLREVLFRFGSWCYNGHVDLGPTLQLEDIPIIIPMLRRQQNALTFMCEASKMPATSLFTPSMEFMAKALPAIQDELVKVEEYVLGGAQSNKASEWLKDDDVKCFFELTVADCEPLKSVEAIASKIFIGQLVLIMLYFDATFYVYIEENDEEQQLLDSTFPDISFQKEGYQIMTYSKGVPGLPELRRLSVWKVVETESDVDSDGETDVNEKQCAPVHPSKDVADAKKVNETLRDERDDADKKSYREDKESDEKARLPKASNKSRYISKPHHIGPLKGHASSRILNKLSEDPSNMLAPWDDTGRPLRLEKN